MGHSTVSLEISPVDLFFRKKKTVSFQFPFEAKVTVKMVHLRRSKRKTRKTKKDVTRTQTTESQPQRVSQHRNKAVQLYRILLRAKFSMGSS